MSLDEFQKSFETNGHKNGQQKTKQSENFIYWIKYYFYNESLI
jgi:hypothetical protein